MTKTTMRLYLLVVTLVTAGFLVAASSDNAHAAVYYGVMCGVLLFVAVMVLVRRGRRGT